MDKRNDLGINLIGYAAGYSAGASGGGGGGGNTAVSVTGSLQNAFWIIDWKDLTIPDTLTTLTGLFFNWRCCNAPKISFNNNITNLEYIYNGCYTPKIDMSGWDITNVTSFYYAFAGVRATEFVFPTTHCTANNVNCTSMIQGVSGTTIDFSGLYIEKVSKIDYICYGLQNVTSIDLRNLQSTGSPTATWAFYNCKALQHLDIRGLGGAISGMNMMTNVPTDCEIIVKNATVKAAWNSAYPSYTNVKTVEEYEG